MFNKTPSDDDYAQVRKDLFGEPDIENTLSTTPSPSAPLVEETNIPQPKRTVLGTAGDIGLSVAEGVIGLGEAAVGLANIPTFGFAGKGLEKIGYDPKMTHEFLDEFYSPAQQYANKKVEDAKGFTGTAAAMLKHPSSIVKGIIETAPQMVGAGAIGRAAKLGPVIGSAIGEGVLGAGSAAESTRQQTEDGTLSLKQNLASIISGAGTGALTLIGGRIAKKFGFDDVDSLLAGSGVTQSADDVVKKIVGAGVSEGVFEELPQSIQETIWSNVALDRPLLENVPESAAEGMILGGVMGSSAHAGSAMVKRNNSPAKGNNSVYIPELGKYEHEIAKNQYSNPIILRAKARNEIASRNHTVEELRQLGANQEALDTLGVGREDIAGIILKRNLDDYAYTAYKDNPDQLQGALQANREHEEEHYRANLVSKNPGVDIDSISKDNQVASAGDPLSIPSDMTMAQARELRQEQDASDAFSEHIHSNSDSPQGHWQEQAQTQWPQKIDSPDTINFTPKTFGSPSTAQQSAEVFSDSKVTELEETLNTQEATMQEREARRAELESTFADSSILTPPEYRPLLPALAKMEQALLEGDQGKVVDREDGTTVPKISTYPEWFKQKTVSQYNKDTGEEISLSQKNVNHIIRKIKKGLPLTNKQTDIWHYLESIAENYNSSDPELVANTEYERIEQEGFELDAPKDVFVGDLALGDQIVVEDPKTGLPDVLTHQGRRDGGNIVLQDGMRYDVDEFDSIPVIGVKKGSVDTISSDDAIAMAESFETASVEEIDQFLTELDSGEVERNNPGIFQYEKTLRNAAKARKADLETPPSNNDQAIDTPPAQGEETEQPIELLDKEISLSAEKSLTIPPQADVTPSKDQEKTDTPTEEVKQVHDYSNTQVAVGGDIAKALSEFGSKIPENELYTDPNDSSYGRETDPHVTVKYGLETDSPQELAELGKLAPFEIELGPVSLFENDDFDVVNAEITGDGIREANKKVTDIAATPGDTFPDYNPHATIAYVKPGKGKKYDGDTSLEGKKVVVDEIQLSSRDGKIHVIKLNGEPSQVDAQPETSKPVDVKNTKKTTNKKAESLEDVGEKLGNAKKHLSRGIKKDLNDNDILDLPFSKIWPKPKLKSDDNSFYSAFMAVARSIVPNKPRATYAKKKWAENVKQVSGIVDAFETVQWSEEKIKEKLRGGSLDFFIEQVSLFQKIDNKLWSKVTSFAYYPEAHRYDGDEKVANPAISVNGKTFYIKEDDSHVDEIKGFLNVAAEKKATGSYEVRVSHHTKKYYINKKGDGSHTSLIEFDKAKDAHAYVRENKEDLALLWEKHKQEYNVGKADIRGEKNKLRVGADYRNGKDVSPESFRDTFGFRGVEFGKWVKQGKGAKDRQGMLNAAYDALADLSAILSIPHKAIALEGTLGLGFGTSGSGKASAHYDPAHVAINLTKTKGAGSLAHEWFHALDNYFQKNRETIKARSREDSYITYKPESYYRHKRGYTLPESRFAKVTGTIKEDWTKVTGVRPEVLQAFANVVETLNSIDMRKRSSLNDKGKADGYWGRIIERGARAFESYVIAKLGSDGNSNDYLANVVPYEMFGKNKGRYPYPTAEEIDAVTNAFDGLFGEIKTKETDKGTILYSKTTAPSNLAETTAYGNTFKTGEPVTAQFIHNTESATGMFGVPDKDSPYGRGYEPSGQYITFVRDGKKSAENIPNLTHGEITFSKPLVVDGESWKEKLSNHYQGKSGKELSKAIIADGYDGIITVDNGHISEGVNLTNFDETQALYSKKTNTSPRSRADIVNEIGAGLGARISNRIFRKGGISILETQEEAKSAIRKFIGDVEFSKRTKQAPQKTIKAYKLFRVVDGKPAPLFIDKASSLELGEWYDADSPLMKDMLSLEPDATYLIDKNGNVQKQSFTNKRQSPSKTLIDKASLESKRYIKVGLYKSGEKSFANWGINGSGSVSPFAMRPGWHMTNVPSARHIGKTDGKSTSPTYRRENEYWAEIEVSADVDYNPEANKRASKDIPEQIPSDGFYSFQTNTNAEKSQDWLIGGSIKVNRFLSDNEASTIAKKLGFKPDLTREPGVDILYSQDGSIQGFFDGKKVHLVADGIEDGNAVSILHHELGVHANKLLQSDDTFGRIKNSLPKRAEKTGKTAEIIKKAFASVPSDTKPEHVNEEALAYLVEHHHDVGFIRQVIARVKVALITIGFPANALTPADLRGLAQIAIRGGKIAQKKEINDGIKKSAKDSQFMPVNTKSDNFQNWFGNSKTVDGKGEPLTLYHGTGEHFTIFGEAERTGKHTSSGLGHFFSTEKTVAKRYASEHGHIMGVNVRIETPYTMSLKEAQSFKTVQDSVARQAELKKLGYDGVVMDFSKQGISPFYVAFNPEQIKSTKNSGEYDRDNPDIRYSKATIEDATSSVSDLIGHTKKKIKKLTDTGKNPEKQDLGFFERILSSFEWISGKAPAAERMLQAQLDRRDNAFKLESEIVDDFGTQLEGYKKKSAEAYKEANTYLLEVDSTGKGFSVARAKGYDVIDKEGKILGFGETNDEVNQLISTLVKKRYGKEKSRLTVNDYKAVPREGWLALDRQGKEISKFESSQQAADFMQQAELDDLSKNGMDKTAIEMVSLFRGMTNRAFDKMVVDLEAVIAEIKEAGIDEPTVENLDESKRWKLTKNRKNWFFETEEAARAVAGHKDKLVRQKDDQIRAEFNLTQMIAQMSDLRGSYFPRQRDNGAIILRATKKGEPDFLQKYDAHALHSEKVDTNGVAINRPGTALAKNLFNEATAHIPFIETLEKKKRELERQGYTTFVDRDTSAPESVFDATSLVASMDSLLQAAKEKSGNKEVSKALSGEITKELANIFKGRGYLSSRISRSEQYVTGFEEDMLLAGMQYAKGLSAGIAKKQSAKEMVLALMGRDISYAKWQEEHPDGSWADYDTFVADRRLDPNKQKGMHGEAMSWMKEMLRNDERADRVLGTIKGLSVLKFLGFRVSSAAVNATNMVQAVPATISDRAEVDISTALNHVRKAGIAYGKYRSGKGQLSQEDREIFAHISENGWDEAQFNHENAHILQSKLGRTYTGVAEFSMKLFGAVEKANRATTTYAAYKALGNTSLNKPERFAKAKEMSDASHGIYGKATMPSWTRGAWNPAKLFFVFQKFSQNYALNMADMGLRGKHKQALYMLLSPAVLAGAGASAATPILAKALGLIKGDDDDYEEKFYDWATEMFGDTGGRYARHGLAGGLLGVNLKGSLQMNNPMPKTLAEVGGAPVSMIKDVGKAWNHAKEGEYLKAGERLLPTGIGNAFKGAREHIEGVTTGSYAPVFFGNEPLRADGLDATMRILGFNPSSISGAREKQWKEYQVKDRMQKRRAKISSQIRKFYLFGNGSQEDIIKSIMKYNELAKGLRRADIRPINARKQIKNAIRRASKPNQLERNR